MDDGILLALQDSGQVAPVELVDAAGALDQCRADEPDRQHPAREGHRDRGREGTIRAAS
jgi:hypothetical protein